MTTSTAATTRPLVKILTSGTVPAVERAAYVYVGDGRFEPCNAAAWREIAAWNQYADRITARSAANRRSLQ